jgi:hypothetical protein
MEENKIPENKRKRKAKTKLEVTPTVPKQPKMAVPTQVDQLSPTSKISIFKIDIFSCNGKPLNGIEVGAADLESIWSETLLRELDEISGYTSSKTKENEIRVQFQLKNPMSLRSIAFEAEFSHERAGSKGVEILRCRVVGLNNIRPATIGEKVKITIIKNNFDVTPDNIINWLSKYGKVHEGHRYDASLYLLKYNY